MRNAAKLVRAGAAAVKLEGGRKRLPMVRAILDAEIPVMGHVGLTPQSVNVMGGFKVQGKTDEAAKILVDDAPYVYMYNKREIRAWSPQVHGFTVRPDQANNFWTVWLEDEG